MDYEPQTGGFPIKRVDLRAPPPGGGDTGMAPPEIGFMDQNVFRLLSATPEQAAAIDTFRGVDSRLALLMQVRTAAVAYDYNTGNGALQFAAPDTILLGPVGADGLPDQSCCRSARRSRLPKRSPPPRRPRSPHPEPCCWTRRGWICWPCRWIPRSMTTPTGAGC